LKASSPRRVSHLKQAWEIYSLYGFIPNRHHNRTVNTLRWRIAVLSSYITMSRPAVTIPLGSNSRFIEAGALWTYCTLVAIPTEDPCRRRRRRPRRARHPWVLSTITNSRQRQIKGTRTACPALSTSLSEPEHRVWQHRFQ
jgi:hypothetical protein